MNSDPLPEDDELLSSLRGLRPSRSSLDVSAVFYQAGFQAGLAERQDAGSARVSQWLIAAAVVALIVAPISFQAGVSSERLVQQPDPTPNTSTIVDHEAQPMDSRPMTVANHQRQQADALPATNIETADQRNNQTPNVLRVVFDQVFPVGKPDQTKATMMLTASFPTNMSDKDSQQRWSSLLIDQQNRYKTFATVSSSPNESGTLAVSDVMNIAKSMGEF